MKCFDAKYNSLPKAELHCHLEGAIRTATIIDIAREYGLDLPAFDVAGLDRRVKVYDQLKDLAAVLEAFGIARQSIASAAVVERIAGELFEDANAQNIKLLEVRFSPDWAFSGHGLNWDDALEGILRAKRRAAARFGMAIGLIAITSRSLGAGSCEKTVDWAIRWKGQHPRRGPGRWRSRAPDQGLRQADTAGEGGGAQSDSPFGRGHTGLGGSGYDPRRQPGPDRPRHAYHSRSGGGRTGQGARGHAGDVSLEQLPDEFRQAH